MNINVAIIDDTASDISALSDIISKYADASLNTVSVKAYNSPIEVINAFDGHLFNFDIAFFDIMMPEMQGTDLIRELQRTNADLRFVLMSSEHNYARVGYRLRAFDFLCKPFNPDEVKDILTRAVGLMNCDTGYVFIMDKSVYKLPFREILLFRSVGNYIHVVTAKTEYRFRKTLRELLKELPESFLQVNRNTIVNVTGISTISRDALTFRGSCLTEYVAAKYAANLLDAFMLFN